MATQRDERSPLGDHQRRRSNRAAETRRTLLSAARDVFTERGFAEASVVEVVERARSSIASVYHHFGGKNELYLALWEEYQSSQEGRAATAVTATRLAGEDDPASLFIAGTRAFLAGSWESRDLVRLFFDGDGPAGFELVRRRRSREWVRQNAVLLHAEDKPVDRVMVVILTTMVGELGREVASCESPDEVRTLIDAAAGFVHRLWSVSPHAG
ncbi:MAG: TetR/AcrR family transcriptional regulator [Streptosporangiaceae bacterium]